MIELMDSTPPPQDERLHDLDRLSFGELSSRADEYYLKKEYNLALIYKAKATRMADTLGEKSKCLLEIAGFYVGMAEVRTDVAYSIREDYLSRAVKCLDLSDKLRSEDNTNIQISTEDPPTSVDIVAENNLDRVQSPETLQKPRYEVGQMVMYCYIPEPNWRMTNGQKPYEPSTIESVEFDGDTFYYKVSVPTLSYQPRESEVWVTKMQGLAEYLRQLE
jgi:hypothetical protein